MNNKTKTIDNWSVLTIFTSYLKHNKAIIVSMFLLPIIFIAVIGANYKVILPSTNSNGALVILLLWLVQSSSFALQTFLSILLDFKQSIIYRRIGLTRIKKINFLIIASIFNLMLMLISNLFIFLVVIILLFVFKLTTIINSIFNWQFILIIVLMVTCLILFTAVAVIMAVFIKTRTGQTIASLIVTFLITIPLFTLVFFLNTIVNSDKGLIGQIGLTNLLIIFFGSFVAINLISTLLYYISWRYFKWYE
ncbi:MAG: hypothetical protein REH79_00860 [Spiroplasma sp.]|nr:hypothetical protein [Spiroplasma sp.]